MYSCSIFIQCIYSKNYCVNCECAKVSSYFDYRFIYILQYLYSNKSTQISII